MGLVLIQFIKAEDPPPGSIPLHINFAESLGQNDYYSSENIPDNSAQRIRNVDFIPNRNLNTRVGNSTVTFGDPSVAIVICANQVTPDITSGGLWIMEESTSTASASYAPNVLLFHYNGSIYRTTIDLKSNVSKIGAAMGTADCGAKSEMNCLSLGTTMFCVGDDFGYTKINDTLSSTIINVSNNTRARFISYYQKRILIGGLLGGFGGVWDGKDKILYTSSTVSTLDSTYFIKMPVTITGIGRELLGVLPFYGANSTYILSGTVFPSEVVDGNMSVRNISQTIGCFHHRTIKNFHNKQYFFSLGENGLYPGIYALNGVTIEEQTKAIRNFFRNNVAITTSPIPSGFIWNDNYCLSVSTKTKSVISIGLTQNSQINNTAICIDENKVIKIFDNFYIDDVVEKKPYTFAVMSPLDATTTNNNFSGLSLLGNNYDNWWNTKSVPLDFEYKTKDYDMGDRSKPKAADRAYIRFKNNVGTFTVVANYDINRDSTTFTINQGTSVISSDITTIMYSSDTIVDRLNFPAGKEFFTINFDITGSSYTSINQLDFFANPMPYR